MDYVPPEPGSPRWNLLSGVFHRLKYMQSSDAILFLDKFAEEEKTSAPLCAGCSGKGGILIYHYECPYE